ncbi:hypothetical protein SUGI_1115210 [Cryptomeria japonica]|uniref:L-gulonolactone oxidase 5 n=1 Tax=Cryptomeria japonica TaxID=3369 RepID=UPI002414917F|nr:L-gulonolactone oxidase 5 [Cryptomeria japonica]GLJ52427.1 hypothetical protein SUGI_1115210 [Cryptomeria japonica]
MPLKPQVTCTIFLLCICLSITKQAYLISACSFPPSPIQCGGSGCTIFNSQGLWEDRAPCRASKSVYPTTEAELVAAVAEAVKNKQKINVLGPWAHSTTKLACVGEGGLVVSTRDYASTRRVDVRARTITVDAGVVLRDLIDEAASNGLAFPTSTSWDGVSMAGSVSTGAHGSSLAGKGSAIYEYVVGMRLVVAATADQGFARVVELGDSDEDLMAARLSLGTLGVISQITFALEPMFKRSVSLRLEDDLGLEDRIEGFLRGYEFGIVYWYVAHGKSLMEEIDRVPVDVAGNGVNKASYQPTTVFKVEQTAAKYDTFEAEKDADALCGESGKSMENKVAKGGGFLNDGENFTGYPVVGFNDLMQTTGGCQFYHPMQRDSEPSSCMPTTISDKNQSICSWDRRAEGRIKFDLEIRVPLARVREAMLDVKRIRDLNPQALCAVEGSGIGMRSVRKSAGAFLGPAEDVVTFETSYYRSPEAFVPTWNMDVFQEIEQMLIEKYGGGLHWGKSGGHLFDGLANKTLNLQRFLAVKERLDPDGLFSNDWTDGLLGIAGKKVEVLKKGCALEKLCKCREDDHCAPEKGYVCAPGRVWTNARVCRKVAFRFKPSLFSQFRT